MAKKVQPTIAERKAKLKADAEAYQAKVKTDLEALLKEEKAENARLAEKKKADEKIRIAQEKEARAKWLLWLGAYAEDFIQGSIDLHDFLAKAECLSPENLKYAGVDYVTLKDSDINFDDAVNIPMAPEAPATK